MDAKEKVYRAKLAEAERRHGLVPAEDQDQDELEELEGGEGRSFAVTLRESGRSLATATRTKLSEALDAIDRRYGLFDR